MSAAAVGEQLGRSARSIRDLCQGADLDPPPPPIAPEDSPARKKPKARRKVPRSFKRRNQSLGRMLPPILLYDSGGGFGIPGETVSAAGLGPNVPVGGQDQFGRTKLSESVVDMGTTLQHDARRYDSARNDHSLDDLPESAPVGTRIVVTREMPDGSTRDFEGVVE